MFEPFMHRSIVWYNYYWVLYHPRTLLCIAYVLALLLVKSSLCNFFYWSGVRHILCLELYFGTTANKIVFYIDLFGSQPRKHSCLELSLSITANRKIFDVKGIFIVTSETSAQNSCIEPNSGTNNKKISMWL